MKALLTICALLAGLNVVAAEKSTRMLVYIGTYTGGPSKGIYAYDFSPKDGSLKQIGLAAETPSPSFLAFHPNKQFLYAVNELDNYGGKKAGSITGFRIDPKTAKLIKINDASTDGAHPCHLTVHREGNYVLAANYSGGSICSVEIGPDGTLGKMADFVQHKGSSVNKQRQGEPHAHSINFDPNSRLALAADLGLDKVMLYQFDPRNGSLKPNDPAFGALPPGGGPRHIAFHPDGNTVFVNNEMLSSVTAFSYAQKTGAMKQIQTISTLPGGQTVPGNSTAEIQAHPSGKFLYCSNRGHNSIAVFSIDAERKLTLVENESTRGKTPRNFGIDPTGSWLIAANQDSDTLAVFRINQQTGALDPVGDTIAAPKPVCVKFLALE